MLSHYLVEGNVQTQPTSKSDAGTEAQKSLVAMSNWHLQLHLCCHWSVHQLVQAMLQRPAATQVTPT